MSTSQPRESTRLTKINEAERQAMLDRLDAAEGDNPAKNKRLSLIHI